VLYGVKQISDLLKVQKASEFNRSVFMAPQNCSCGVGTAWKAVENVL